MRYFKQIQALCGLSLFMTLATGATAQAASELRIGTYSDTPGNYIQQLKVSQWADQKTVSGVITYNRIGAVPFEAPAVCPKSTDQTLALHCTVTASVTFKFSEGGQCPDWLRLHLTVMDDGVYIQSEIPSNGPMFSTDPSVGCIAAPPSDRVEVQDKHVHPWQHV